MKRKFPKAQLCMDLAITNKHYYRNDIQQDTS